MSILEWKDAPQRGHQADQDMGMPHLSSKQTVVWVPTRACSRGQKRRNEREVGAIDQTLISNPSSSPNGTTSLLYRPYRDGGQFLCPACATPRPNSPPSLGERSSDYGETTLKYAERGPFHSMEARRREEREIERHLRRPCLSVRLREFAGAGQRKSLVSKGRKRKEAVRDVKDS